MLNEKFINYFEFLKTQNPSIDESMVPYYGRQSAKQFICGKPIRFGYKMSVITTTLGYVVQIELYQGAQVQQTQYEGRGMGGSVVMDLISELHEEVGNSFHLTFDNLVTSLTLVDCLTAKQIACTGTIRANRVENEMKKLPIGSFDHILMINQSLRLSDGIITTSSMMRHVSIGRPRGFASSANRVPEQIRFDRLDHLVQP